MRVCEGGREQVSVGDCKSGSWLRINWDVLIILDLHPHSDPYPEKERR
jgi:hypothetical protein